MENKYNEFLKTQEEIKLEKNYMKVIEFINSKNCHIEDLELSDFLQENDIPYLFFENTKDYFNYINEDERTNFNVTARQYVIFTEGGELFILTN